MAFADDRRPGDARAGPRVPRRGLRSVRRRHRGRQSAGDGAGPTARSATQSLQLGAVLLEKNLPVAAGLGGGSADAAALLRAVRRANPERAGAVRLARAGRPARAPTSRVCLAGTPALISGIGDKVEPLGAAHELPPVAAVLVNPRLPLPTAQVFGPWPQDQPRPAVSRPRLPVHSPTWQALSTSCAAAATTSSDRQPRSCRLVADIKAALAAQPGCCIAAMSGSGPTCFGIFADDASAARATAALAAMHPRWWVVATQVVGSSEPGPSDAANISS